MNLPKCFDLIPGFASGIEIGPILEQAWEQKTIKLFGQEHEVPRLTLWFGEGYTYSGIKNVAAPMPAWLDELRSRAEKASGARFNSALLNYYRDGKDSVSWHADDEKELGTEPTIASLSIGASRAFAIKERAERLGEIETGKERARWSLQLNDGDLLIMRGESQRDYLHSIPKTSKEVGARVNITFRWIG
jgi:alkylated DNA repair dioxygenase AlkB